MFSSGRRFDRATALFLSLVAIGFIVATFDVRSQGGGAGGVLRDGAQTLFTPLQKASDFVTRPVVGFIDGVSNIAGLRDENERLLDRVTELETALQETTALERRLAELEAINDLEPPEELAAVTARVYSAGPSAFDHIRYIDKGTADGIVAGHAVVDERGLVGRVDRASEHNARVRLITDPLVSIGVRVRDTNETGLVSGQGGAVLRLEMFQATLPVRQGALVVTDGSRFPPGVIVGTVARTADTEAGFALRTTVVPAVVISQLDFVRVVVGWSPLEADLEEIDPVVEPPPILEEDGERR
jgi:rod shape-determining protein MreC